MKVLIVDDDSQTLELLKKILEIQGYQCFSFQKSEEALGSYLLTTKYDVVITDYSMPYVNGINIVKGIKRVNPEAHIIMYTGYDDRRIEKLAIDNGTDYFFYKPLDIAELIEKLKIIETKIK